MADFVHRIRLGEEVGDVIDEFRDKGHVDFRGRPWMASYKSRKQKGQRKMNSPHDRMSKDLAREWCRNFVQKLARGELPAPFGTPGIVNPVDRGLATRYLRWMDPPNFKRPYKFKNKKTFKPAADDDRSQWTAEQWTKWWAGVNGDGPQEDGDDVQGLLAKIKAQVGTNSSREASS